MDITVFWEALGWFPTPTSLGASFLISRYTGVQELGRREGQAFACSTKLMAALLPVGPQLLTSLRGSVCRGHAGVATAGSTRGHVKFSAGAVSVHWVLLIPCPLSVFLPLSFSFLVCVCVLIIRWLLACFPNPTLTFLSATEKLGIPPTGKQSKRPGRTPALCTNPSGPSPCPIAKEEDVRIHTACKQKAFRSHGSTPTSGPFYRWGSWVPEGMVTCTSSSRFNQSKMTQVFCVCFFNCYHKAFCNPVKHSAPKAFPHTKKLQWKWCFGN